MLPKESRASKATTTSSPASTHSALVPSSRATLLEAAGVPTCTRQGESKSAAMCVQAI